MPIVRVEVPVEVAAVAAYVKATKNVPLPKVYGAMLAVSMRQDTLEQYVELLFRTAMSVSDAAAQSELRKARKVKERVKPSSV